MQTKVLVEFMFLHRRFFLDNVLLLKNWMLTGYRIFDPDTDMMTSFIVFPALGALRKEKSPKETDPYCISTTQHQ